MKPFDFNIAQRNFVISFSFQPSPHADVFFRFILFFPTLFVFAAPSVCLSPDKENFTVFRSVFRLNILYAFRRRRAA